MGLSFMANTHVHRTMSASTRRASMVENAQMANITFHAIAWGQASRVIVVRSTLMNAQPSHARTMQSVSMEETLLNAFVDRDTLENFAKASVLDGSDRLGLIPCQALGTVKLLRWFATDMGAVLMELMVMVVAHARTVSLDLIVRSTLRQPLIHVKATITLSPCCVVNTEIVT
jgi:hypothetical protein